MMIRFHPSVVEWLKRAALREGVSGSEIVRRLVASYMATSEERRRSAKAAARALLADDDSTSMNVGVLSYLTPSFRNGLNSKKQSVLGKRRRSE
jgi:hypothetical protein